MKRPGYRKPVIITTVGAVISIGCLASLVVLWTIISSSDSSTFTESADQVLTWLNIDHTIGTGDHGISVWVWVLSAFLGAGAGLGLLILSIGLIWLIIVAIKEPKVRETTAQGVSKSRDLSQKGIASSKELSQKSLVTGKKVSGQLRERYSAWRNR